MCQLFTEELHSNFGHILFTGSGGKKTEHVCTAKTNFPNLVNLTVPLLCKSQLLSMKWSQRKQKNKEWKKGNKGEKQ